ncbi:hypothetical protein BJY24_002157 [Nocardia transvalensis]|uniref:DUF397 domain-containing protein n=1 Tax=Nocardia transvalensis TaxID=37333 RepID=A0A7W9UI28_9NOCA|nr:DUF397 domain-containing protein [Nocardia transvalensis]MBB5913290.1 hypothetical protein [Nocardia transvalensis]
MKIDLSGVSWFKSSHSGGENECVEVAWLEGSGVGVRDSKNPSGPALIFAPGEWDAFVADAKVGKFTRR